MFVKILEDDFGELHRDGKFFPLFNLSLHSSYKAICGSGILEFAET